MAVVPGGDGTGAFDTLFAVAGGITDELVGKIEAAFEVEEWRTIPSKNKYEASSLGNIRNKKTKHVMAKCKDGAGYMAVGLCVDDPATGKVKQTLFKVARLVAETFLPDWTPDTKKLTVDHIDSTKRADDRVINLRMATKKVQSNNQKRPEEQEGKWWPVVAIDPMTKKIVHEFPSVKKATAAMGLKSAGISHVLNGRATTAAGYMWQYKTSPDLPGEIWKQFKTSALFVSNEGRVKRRAPTGKFGIARHSYEIDINGVYPSVKVEGIDHSIHIVVANVFLGPAPDPDMIVNHKNGDKKDARLSNLEYATRSARF